MAEDKREDGPKPSLFGRLFGRGPRQAEPASEAPAEAGLAAAPLTDRAEAEPTTDLPPGTEASVAGAVVDGLAASAAASFLPQIDPIGDIEAITASLEPEPSESDVFEPAAPDALTLGALPSDLLDADLATEPLSAEPPAAEAPPVEPRRSWWARLRDGLARSSSSLGSGIADIFTKQKLDDAMLEDLEDVLIRSDLGVATASRVAQAVGKGRYDRHVSPGEVRAILAAEVERILAPLATPIATDAARKPFVILVIGVNGSGKTTTIGKLAAKFTGEGKRVTLAAGDTFRAAAVAQLQIWGERLGCAVVAREQGADAASLGYQAIEEARRTGADILLMDTAGRLQNRTELMAELEKIIRVMRKVEAGAPHAVLLVLDATVGQNAMSQVEIFGKVAGVTGLVMTKLDGTARGGILVAIAERFKLPIHFIGVGETADDLEPFSARDFAAAIAGLEQGAASGA